MSLGDPVKRVVVTVNVAADMEDATVAEVVNQAFEDVASPYPDATAWEWDRFWLDVDEGVVGPERDLTRRERR